MKTLSSKAKPSRPTLEDIDALIRREFPGFRLDVGSHVEVIEGGIRTYDATVEESEEDDGEFE